MLQILKRGWPILLAIPLVAVAARPRAVPSERPVADVGEEVEETDEGEVEDDETGADEDEGGDTEGGDATEEATAAVPVDESDACARVCAALAGALDEETIEEVAAIVDEEELAFWDEFRERGGRAELYANCPAGDATAIPPSLRAVLARVNATNARVKDVLDPDAFELFLEARRREIGEMLMLPEAVRELIG